MRETSTTSRCFNPHQGFLSTIDTAPDSISSVICDSLLALALLGRKNALGGQLSRSGRYPLAAGETPDELNNVMKTWRWRKTPNRGFKTP